MLGAIEAFIIETPNAVMDTYMASPSEQAEFNDFSFDEQDGAVNAVDDAAKNMDRAEIAKSVVENTDFTSFPKTIHMGKQGKHIVGSNNYVLGKSIISIPSDTLQKLVYQYSGKGRGIYGTSKEIVDFGEVIGQYVDGITGKACDTTIGTIHYSKSGVHVVPARPKG